MKIAIYSGSIPNSAFVENLISEVSKTYQVLIFGTVEGAFEYSSKNIKIIDTPKSVSRNIPLTLLRALKLAFKDLRLLLFVIKESKKYSGWYVRWMRFARFVPVLLYKPDVFHLQWVSEVDRWTFLKDAYACKLVVSLLGTHINISPIVNKQIEKKYIQHFPKVDVFHSINKKIGNEILRYGVAPDRVKMVYTTLNEDLFNRTQGPKIWNLKKRINIVSVGRYHWVKGYRYALHAINILLKKGYEVNYTIVAPGEPTEELIYQRNQLNLQGSVCFKNSLVQYQLFDYLKAYDLFLLPSLSEGIANVVLEAMMLGLPVLSTDCGGMNEIVKHKVTGWLVEVRNPKAMAIEIENIINSDHLVINNITRQAYERVKQDFNPRKITKSMIKLY